MDSFLYFYSITGADLLQIALSVYVLAVIINDLMKLLPQCMFLMQHIPVVLQLNTWITNDWLQIFSVNMFCFGLVLVLFSLLYVDTVGHVNKLIIQ